MFKVRGTMLQALCGLSIGFFIFSCSGCRTPARQIPSEYSKGIFSPQDRILVFAPHPDDETIGCGGIIQQALKRNIPVKVVFLTYGDNNQWSFLVYRKHPVLFPRALRTMGLVRHNEAIAATRVLGLSKDDLVFLGYPDSHTLKIWYAHWGESPPAEDLLTHTHAVPYKSAFHPGAPYKGEEVLKDIETVIKDFRPTKIYVSHPADHNPDHQAFYLFTRVALWDLNKEKSVKVYPYLVHYSKWPQPKKFDPKKKLLPPKNLKDKARWVTTELTSKELAEKFLALKKHRSQYQSSPRYLRLFIRANELFGDFPEIALKKKAEENPGEALLNDIREEETQSGADQLLAEERASFVGIETSKVTLDNNELVFSLKLSRPLGKAVGLSCYVFGYRKDKDFKDMPKLHIKFGAIEHKVFDQSKPLDRKLVKVTRNARQVTIRVPLGLAGFPQKVLTSARTYIGDVPLDWVGWRVLDLTGAKGPAD